MILQELMDIFEFAVKCWKVAITRHVNCSRCQVSYPQGNLWLVKKSSFQLDWHFFDQSQTTNNDLRKYYTCHLLYHWIIVILKQLPRQNRV